MSDKPVAEKWADRERREDPEREQLPRPDPEPEVADHDLVIERKDLGPESGTFVAEGDPIPPALASLPRRPARAAPRKR
jgi:hypothetical protein